jgi:hypothetical protein
MYAKHSTLWLESATINTIFTRIHSRVEAHRLPAWRKCLFTYLPSSVLCLINTIKHITTIFRKITTIDQNTHRNNKLDQQSKDETGSQNNWTIRIIPSFVTSASDLSLSLPQLFQSVHNE